jgi:hypothetical protein
MVKGRMLIVLSLVLVPGGTFPKYIITRRSYRQQYSAELAKHCLNMSV